MRGRRRPLSDGSAIPACRRAASRWGRALAVQSKDDELTDARECRQRLLRHDFQEIQEAIGDAEEC